MSSWLEKIQHIFDGEPVDAGVAGRPDRQLEQNLRHIKELLELSLLGQALIARDVAIKSDLVVGEVVYWNAENARAEKALARVEFNEELQTLVGANESEVYGVLWRKSGSTLGDIVLMGWVELDITASAGANPAAGRYYLSGQTPGALVLARPSLSVPVLHNTGDGRVLILPQWRNWAEDHEHFQIKLVCAPAGDTEPPEEGEQHVITGADDALQGWLPADHASFEDHAPTGAKFGYNLAAHPLLQRLWPPFPPEAASFIWDKGQELLGGTEVPDTLVVADRYGIWWMSDCYGDVPWPTLFTFTDGDSTDGPSESESLTCPREEDMTLTVHFLRTLFDATRTVVTSLRAPEGSIITIVGCDGDPAATGDLIIDAILDLAIDQQDATGHLVLKNIVDSKFKRGPVLEGIKNGGGLEISSTHPKTLEDDTILYQGVATITLPPDPAERELLPFVTRLGDTKERFENEIPFIGFPAGYQTSIRQAYFVAGGISADTRAAFRLKLTGTAAGVLPTLTVTYRRIPAGDNTPDSLPLSDSALTLPAMPTLASTGQYVQLDTSEITIQPGDTVLFTLGRSTGDGYTGEVGSIRTTLALLPPEESEA